MLTFQIVNYIITCNRLGCVFMDTNRFFRFWYSLSIHSWINLIIAVIFLFSSLPISAGNAPKVNIEKQKVKGKGSKAGQIIVATEIVNKQGKTKIKPKWTSADNIITSAQLSDNSVSNTKIDDNAITNPKMADDSVNTAEIVNDAVTSNKILDGTIVSADFQDGAVTTIKLGDDSITSAKIVDSTIVTVDLADNSVTNPKMADNAIGNAEMLDNAIGNAELINNAVNSDKILDGTISAIDLQVGAVTSAKIFDGTISAIDLQVGSVTNAKLADNVVNNAKLSDNAVHTAEILDDAVTGVKIDTNAVSTSKILDYTIDSADINTGVRPARFVVDINDNGADYTDIQSAINDLPASGGLVFVRMGTYSITPLGLNINKANTIVRGEGPGTVISSGLSSDLITISANDVTLEQMSIINSSATSTANSLKITGNKAIVDRVTFTYTGSSMADHIALSGSNDSKILNCNISGSPVITSTNSSGINLGTSNNVQIKDCKIECEVGVEIDGSSNRFQIIDNTLAFSVGDTTEKIGVTILDSATTANGMIMGNSVFNAYRAVVINRPRVTIASNIIDNCSGGIYTNASTNSGDHLLITGNSIFTSVNSDYSIFLQDSVRSIIANNRIYHPGTASGNIAINFVSTSDSIINGNAISVANPSFGRVIALTTSDRNAISGNVIDGSFLTDSGGGSSSQNCIIGNVVKIDNSSSNTNNQPKATGGQSLQSFDEFNVDTP